MHITTCTLSKKKTYIIQNLNFKLTTLAIISLHQGRHNGHVEDFMRSCTQVFQASMFLELISRGPVIQFHLNRNGFNYNLSCSYTYTRRIDIYCFHKCLILWQDKASFRKFYIYMRYECPTIMTIVQFQFN